MASRRVLKTHLKHDDGVRLLSKRAKATILKKMNYQEPESQQPQEVTGLINPIKERMDTLRDGVFSGQSSILAFLESLDEEKLEAVKRIYNKNNFTKTISEELILQSVPLLMDDLNLIQTYEDHLKSAKSLVISTYVDCYSFAYNECRGHTVHFDNTAFISDIDKALSFRRALRRCSESQQNGDLNQPAEDSRCVIC